jgi:tetratricopeptide (TPR) repeat protein
MAATGAGAQKPPDITAGEMALLPPYCPDTQTMSAVDPRGSEKGAHWVSVLGNAFWGLHHYCWGLIRVNRASRAGVAPQMRRYLYESAINDYQYVLENSPPNFVLLPEIYLRIGEASVELQAYATAMEAFQRSREIKPDYWPPYVRAAAVLTRLGKNAEAAALLQEGLTRMPSEPALLDAYKHTGRPLPKPPTTSSAASVAASAPLADGVSARP